MSRNEDNVSQDDGTKRLRAIRGGNRGKITRLERDATVLMREYGTEGSMIAEEVVLKLTSGVVGGGAGGARAPP